MSRKNSDGTIGNRTRDLPACREVPQQNAPPRAPILEGVSPEISRNNSSKYIKSTQNDDDDDDNNNNKNIL